MLNRTSFSSKYPGFAEGKPVYSSDGEKLGKVASLGDDYFIVEKGLFFPKDFTLRYDDILDFRDDSIYLNLTADDFEEWKNETYSGWRESEDINEGRLSAYPRDEYKSRYPSWSSKEQVEVPITEEQLDAQKVQRQAGEVKLRKLVHTEYRHFTVPVTREEVKIERVPATGATTTANTSEAFQEKTVSIPVMEEEVTVTKRPVVKEHVRVSKEHITEQRKVEGEVRKEEVKIEGEDKLKKRTA